MKFIPIILTIYVSAVLTENRVPRAQLKNLGISLRSLKVDDSVPQSNKNIVVKVTDRSSSPTAFGFPSLDGRTVGFSSEGDSLGFGISSQASSTSTGGHGGSYDYSSQSGNSNSGKYSFSSQGQDGIGTGDPVDSLHLFNKNLNEFDNQVTPFPIIPVNSHSEESYQKHSDTKVPPQHFKQSLANNDFSNTYVPVRETYDPFVSQQAPYEEVSFDRQQQQVPILSGPSIEQILEQDWTDFKIRFNKVYPSEQEGRYRREIFIENRAKIMRFNMEYAEGKRNFVHNINEFTDMLNHEFSDNFNGFNKSLRAPSVATKPASTFLPSANVVFPESVDWRLVGAVGPVKSQGKCAGCYAFAAAGALEGHHFRKTGKLVEVSVQNLIDCTQPYGNNGCSGGLMDPAFEYVRDNNGVDSESSYPFEERDATCRFKRENVVATCTGFVDIGENDEKGIEIALATLGPVTAAIDAGQETFQFYSNGIYDDSKCGNKPEQMNHAVLIVGYGQEPDGRKYWLVKNSYGPNWGIGGYIKIAKENNNQCGIAIKASYPLV